LRHNKLMLFWMISRENYTPLKEISFVTETKEILIKHLNRMKVLKILLLVMPLTLLVYCSGNKDKSGNSDQPQVQVQQQKETDGSTPQDAMRKEGQPGFDNKFDRGKKKRESIVDKFDQFGNMIERTENDYDNYGNVKHKNRYTYKYDQLQRRVEQRFYQYTPDDRPMMSNVNFLKYNNRDLQTENIFIGYDANGAEVNWAKNEYKHNADGQVIQDITYNKQGFPVFEANYNWENGLLKSENFVYYDGKGGVVEKKTLKYNETGTVIETINE
jgi:hypothetical protein